MARAERLSFSLVYTGILLAMVLLPDFLGAIPVRQHEEESASAVSSEVKSEAMANLKKLVRTRRNLPPVHPQFKRLPDFWGWYKYFMETGNQEGVEDLDRMYRAFLQNKHKSEEAPTFNHYLNHLSEIYKTCADSDDPECIAEHSSKPTAKLVMPAPIKAAAVRVCNPYYDPYCLFPMIPKAAAPEPAPEPAPAPAPAKVPAPILAMPAPYKGHPGFYFYAPEPAPEPEPAPLLPMPMKGHPGYYFFAPPEPAPEPAPVKLPAPYLTPFLPMPMKTSTGFYYYAPVLEPFLTAEQKTELLRICNPTDVECLQYHLRAAYGYRSPPGPVPSYSALGCDPTKDPYCKPLMVKKGPSGYYHLYPSTPCNPAVDPLCSINVVPPGPEGEAGADEEPPKEQHCNPLFDKGCNPLTATKLASLSKPVLEYTPNDEPAAPPAPALAPWGGLPRAAAALRAQKPPPRLPEFQVRSRLGVQGKTKDGHDCYVHYDEDCTPVEAGADAKASSAAKPAKPACHPYDFSCNGLAPNSAIEPSKNGVIAPADPDCDPEFDYNCRLRRADPAAAAEAADEPVQQEAAPEYPVPRFEDFLRGYMGQYKK